MKPVFARSNLFAILLCGALTACGNLNNRQSEATKEVQQPTQEELEVKKKKSVKENIAKYVTLNMEQLSNIYVTNDTDYTLESVSVLITWEEWGNSERHEVSKLYSFTYIPAHTKSNSISKPGSGVRGQITSISCSALGL